MLEIKHLTKTFRKKKAINDFNGTFQGGIYGLLGANGAGKTTLLRCITGLYKENAGEILWDGENIKTSKTYKSSIGYLPQKFEGLKDLKVTEFLEYFGDLNHMKVDILAQRIDEVLQIVHLEERKKSKVGSLSGGMVRRLGIAQALLNDPKLLIFDEPTAGLDPEERLRFKNILTALPKDKIIMISTHIVEDIETSCDHIVVMKEGALLGIFSPEELASKAKGKVYEVSEKELGQLDGKYKVIREYHRDGETKIRVLATNDQTFVPVEETIEDGYLWLTTEDIF